MKEFVREHKNVLLDVAIFCTVGLVLILIQSEGHKRVVFSEGRICSNSIFWYNGKNRFASIALNGSFCLFVSKTGFPHVMCKEYSRLKNTS